MRKTDKEEEEKTIKKETKRIKTKTKQGRRKEKQRIKRERGGECVEGNENWKK